MSKNSAEKGIRFTLSLRRQYHEKLAEIAKKHHINQGEVIEVLLDLLNQETHQAAFKAKRTDKIGRRTSIRAMIEREKAKREALGEPAVEVIQKTYRGVILDATASGAGG